MTLRTLTFAALLSTTFACGGTDVPTTDTGATATPTAPTTTANVYTSDWAGVQDLFDDKCISCHVAGGQAGFSLFDTITAEQTDGDPSNDNYVSPGSPDDSRLWRALSHGDLAVAMPFGSSEPLPDAEIGHVREWIAAGASLD